MGNTCVNLMQLLIILWVYLPLLLYRSLASVYNKGLLLQNE